MIDLDLRRLAVLRAVAHHGTVTAAAEATHVTASAASHQIRQLGRELGLTLLEPQGRGVRLTQSARELLEHAHSLEERWERAYAALHRDDAPAGTLRLCAIPTALSALLAPAAEALALRHPGLVPRISEAEPAEAFDLLLTEAVDVAVFEATPETPNPTDPRFEQETLLRDPFDLLVPRGHPLAGHEPPAPATTTAPTTATTLADAASEPWVLEAASSSSRHYTLTACNSAGFSPDIAHEARQWSVVATLVAHHLGVALVPRLAQLPAQLDVVRLPLHGSPAPARVLLTAVRRGSRGQPAIAACVAALHEAAQRPGGPDGQVRAE